jgi:hypothetical protein
MRRLLVPLAAMCLFCAAMMGCARTHGVCDCYQEDPCFQRAPWAMPQAEIIQEIPKTEAKKLPL